MGADIHAILQVKNTSGDWMTIPEIPKIFDSRNYFLFDTLIDICNSGLPEEVKGKKYRYNENYKVWEVDFSEGCDQWYCDFGWLTLQEFKDYLFKHNPYFVSIAFYDMFIELGGKFPEAMIMEGYGDNSKVIFNVLDVDEAEDLDYLLFVESEFAEVAKNYNLENNPENIRVVFAFDN
jgi:hypothetical protein